MSSKRNPWIDLPEYTAIELIRAIENIVGPWHLANKAERDAIEIRAFDHIYVRLSAGYGYLHAAAVVIMENAPERSDFGVNTGDYEDECALVERMGHPRIYGALDAYCMFDDAHHESFAEAGQAVDELLRGKGLTLLGPGLGEVAPAVKP